MVENKRRRIVHGSGWALACVLLACPTVVTAQVEVGEDDDLKPSWPHPASRCRMDAQCDVGLVCEPLDISVWPPMNLPNGAPRNGRQVCQPGCRIDGTFYYPEVLDGENDCQWCAPETDRFGWTHLSAGTACGSGADTECTSPDTCDGAGACLANDEPPTTPCGDAGDACTNQDYCDGSGSCTDNGFVAADTPCGSDADTACTSPDTCDGAGTCQTHDEADGTACSSDDNDCTTDVCSDGVCTHTSAPFGTACGDSSTSDCDFADTCDGDGQCQENFVPEGFACGSPSDTDCDNPDTCDGQGHCQANVEEAGAGCGDPTDTECNAPDTCNGLGDCVHNVAPAGQTCGDVETACTNVDTCNGAGSCTDNGFKDASTACTGASNGGDCDDDANDHCSGTDDTCVDAYAAAGTACGDATDDECNAADTCDGSGICQDNLANDGTFCNGGGACSDGTCCGFVCNDPETGELLCGNIENDCGDTLECGACLGDTEGTGCSFGLIADQNGICRQPLLASCDNDVDCLSGLCECGGAKDGSQCDSAGGVCLLARGEACLQDSDCNSADRCELAADGVKRCLIKPIEIGGACNPYCASNPAIPYYSFRCNGGSDQACIGGPNNGIPCSDPDADGFDLDTCQVELFPGDFRGGRCGGDECYFRGTICKGGGADDGEPCSAADDCDGGICEAECPGGGTCMLDPQGGYRHGFGQDVSPVPGTAVCSELPPGCAPLTGIIEGSCPGSNWVDPLCFDPREPDVVRGCYKSAVDPPGPFGYGTPVCCLGLGEVCEDDSDCCKGGFGEAEDSSDPYRFRACLAADSDGPKTCRRVALAGDGCATDDDCISQTPLFCNTSGECAAGTAPNVLAQGEVCQNEDDGVLTVLGECAAGLVCSDCNLTGNGWRCTPPLDDGGCCSNGNDDLNECPGSSGFFCNAASGCRAGEPCSSDDDCGCFGSGDFGQCEPLVTDRGTCCNFECTLTSIDADNCGACGRNCGVLPDFLVGGSACWTPTDSTTCSDYACDWEYNCAEGQTCYPQGDSFTCVDPVVVGDPSVLLDCTDLICCSSPASPCCSLEPGDSCTCTFFEMVDLFLMCDDVPTEVQGATLYCDGDSDCSPGYTCYYECADALDLTASPMAQWLASLTCSLNRGVCVAE